MEKLLSSIKTRLTYITTNSDNAFILKRCETVNMELDSIRNKQFSTMEAVKQVTDRIMNVDVSIMKRVAGQTNLVYKKMDELANFVSQIPDLYFLNNDVLEEETVVEETVIPEVVEEVVESVEEPVAE